MEKTQPKYAKAPETPITQPPTSKEEQKSWVAGFKEGRKDGENYQKDKQVILNIDSALSELFVALRLLTQRRSWDNHAHIFNGKVTELRREWDKYKAEEDSK